MVASNEGAGREMAKSAKLFSTLAVRAVIFCYIAESVETIKPKVIIYLLHTLVIH